MRKIVLLLLLLLPLSLSATTVSGNLRDVGLNSLTQNVVIRFTLVGYGGNLPRVVGTSVIADDKVDFRPDSNGDISGTIQGNDTIDPSSTFYRVCVILKGRRFRCADYNITGASFDLNSAAPITTAPTVTPPTGDTVYQRLDGGNQATGNYVPNSTGLNLGSETAEWNSVFSNAFRVGASQIGVLAEEGNFLTMRASGTGGAIFVGNSSSGNLSVEFRTRTDDSSSRVKFGRNDGVEVGFLDGGGNFGIDGHIALNNLAIDPTVMLLIDESYTDPSNEIRGVSSICRREQATTSGQGNDCFGGLFAAVVLAATDTAITGQHIGVRGELWFQDPSVSYTVTNAIGVHSTFGDSNSFGQNVTLTNWWGVFVGAPPTTTALGCSSGDNCGSITNGYGMQIDEIPSSVTNRAALRLPCSGVGCRILWTNTDLQEAASGVLQASATTFVITGKARVDTGVDAAGPGMKHGRVTTGSISTSSDAAVTLTWATPAFADTNYTPTCSVIDATTTTSALRVHHIESISTTTIVVRVVNDDSGGAHTGTLSCIGLHD